MNEFATGQLVAVALLWAVWCTLHSLLIAPSVTRLLKRRWGRRYGWYRIVYNAIAVITLAPVAYFTGLVDGDAVIPWSGGWVALRVALIAAAIALFVLGARHYDLLSLVGLRDASQLRQGREPQEAPEMLVTTGILGLVRHPWYLGVMLILWGWASDSAQVVTAAVLTGYLVIGAFLEERKLVMEFGDEYREYQERVSMLFPWKWITSRFRRQVPI